MGTRLDKIHCWEDSDHTYKDAKFNDDGSFFYAWSLGSPDDRLQIWRTDTITGSLIKPEDSVGSYKSVRLP